MKKKRTLGVSHAIVQLCLCIFCIMFPMQIIKNQIMEQDKLSQILLILVFAFAGIGIYVMLGRKLKKEWEES